MTNWLTNRPNNFFFLWLEENLEMSVDLCQFLRILLQRNPNNPFEIIEHKLNICKATKSPLWLTLIFVYKGILLLYGLFLAYETRNVVYAHLNDSRVIGYCVYNVVVSSTIGAFLSVILDDTQYKELYAVLSLCIIFPATTTISLIFLPKVRTHKSN